MIVAPRVPYDGSMDIDTKRTALDLDELLPGVVLLEGVDALGTVTDDPTRAVEGLALFSFRDGSTKVVSFDRRRPL